MDWALSNEDDRRKCALVRATRQERETFREQLAKANGRLEHQLNIISEESSGHLAGDDLKECRVIKMHLIDELTGSVDPEVGVPEPATPNDDGVSGSLVLARLRRLKC